MFTQPRNNTLNINIVCSVRDIVIHVVLRSRCVDSHADFMLDY